MKQQVVIFWFRRELRLNDNHGLYKALISGFPVLPVFIFDTQILENLHSKEDARVSFIYTEIQKIKNNLEKKGNSILVFNTNPLDAFKNLVELYNVKVVFANKDYEPYGRQRDERVGEFLQKHGVGFQQYKDLVVFEQNEVVKNSGEPYTVFTSYSKKWKQVFSNKDLHSFPSEDFQDRFLKTQPFVFPGLNDLGFVKSKIQVSSPEINPKELKNYEQTRDFPAISGTTRLGIHLRFGTISIRKLTRISNEYSNVYLNELIWRNFFSTILWHFPHVVNSAFKPRYNFINWRNNEKEFELWQKGETGYPMVDAGMRELNETGFMHNRLRMITAGFLTKHLLIDWRWGEAYFAEKLLDYELASNNGNWQWAAGTGCDAAPYFRIFNPWIQQKKFDPLGVYVNKWVPESTLANYPKPIVEHKFARERALRIYKQCLK